MKTTVVKVRQAPQRTNSSFGNWALDCVIEHDFQNGVKSIAVRTLFYWTKKKALEVQESIKSGLKLAI